MELKHVRQKGKNDCGVAVLAMMGDMTYRQAAAYCVSGLGRGVKLSEMLLALQSTTGTEWNVWRSRRQFQALFFSGVLPVKERFVVLVRPGNVRWGHWVCMDDGLVYDPEMPGPRIMGEYHRADWAAIRILTNGG